MPSTTGAKGSDTVRISLSMLSTTGTISNIRNTEGARETKMFMVDPGGHKVEQIYICADDPAKCKPADKLGWTTKELTSRGVKHGDGFKILTEEQIEEAKGSKLEKGLLDLAIHPAEQVEANTWPSGSTYFVDPERSDPVYAYLVEKAADPTIALVGLMNLRGNDKLYRVQVGLGGLVLQELVRPDEVHAFTVEFPALKEKERVMGDALVGALTEDFDPEEYNSDKVKALRELIASVTGGATITPIKGKPVEQLDDLETQLAAAIAAAQAAKAAKKARKAS